VQCPGWNIVEIDDILTGIPMESAKVRLMLPSLTARPGRSDGPCISLWCKT